MAPCTDTPLLYTDEHPPPLQAPPAAPMVQLYSSKTIRPGSPFCEYTQIGCPLRSLTRLFLPPPISRELKCKTEIVSSKIHGHIPGHCNVRCRQYILSPTSPLVPASGTVAGETQAQSTIPAWRNGLPDLAFLPRLPSFPSPHPASQEPPHISTSPQSPYAAQ